jgi:predicted alpha/beta-fold hydrolase
LQLSEHLEFTMPGGGIMQSVEAARLALFGHAWTLRPYAIAPFQSTTPLEGERPWSTSIVDPRRGALRLTGRLRMRDDDPSRPLAVLVHGLGGTIDSLYVVALAHALAAVGVDTLRLHLRGADGEAPDYYHAGLDSDLAAALASPEIEARTAVGVVGFSLGGHLALRLAASETGPRPSAVVAVCPPLDLASGARELDRLHRRPYLRHVLSGLVAMYRAVAARGPVPIAVDEAARIRSLYAWDERVVAPRHGFAGADDYYAKVSVARRLGSIETPTLVVVGADDPMIPASIVTPWLASASRAVDARVVPGGHVGFSRSLDLGERAPRGLDPQLASWVARTLAR